MAAGIEIAEDLLEQGHKVEFIVCNADLPACYGNPSGNILKCLCCIGKRNAALRMVPLSTRITVVPLNAFMCKRIGAQFPSSFDSIEELKKCRVENFDIGFAALSTVVSRCRDPEPNLRQCNDLLQKVLRAAYTTYYCIRGYLRSRKCDKLYVYNGRFAITRAAVRAAMAEGVRFCTFDRGHDKDHYEVFENSLPHDIQYIHERIQKTWLMQESHKSREDRAAQFFLERRNGVAQNWVSFVDRQDPSSLPADWDTLKRNVVIFLSSEDEFVAIGTEWRNPIYPNQLSAVRDIINSLTSLKRSRFHYYLRMHPNQASMAKQYLDKWTDLSAPFITLILPKSKVSSYKLIDGADRILTFGSTIGIESVFWGKPSILAGPCFYRDLGGTYNPKSHVELMDLLLADKLSPKNREAALKYGYYMKTYGRHFKRYAAHDVFTGSYRDIALESAKSIPLLTRALIALHMFDRRYLPTMVRSSRKLRNFLFSE